MTLFALLPSPLLGSAVWLPVAVALTATGHDAVAVALSGLTSSPADVLAAFVTATPADQELVLVAHSNAGLYLPAVAAARQARALLFVDATLPPFEGGQVPAAAPEFQQFLSAKAREDGMLPPWSEWWDEDLAALFPDQLTQQQVEAQQHRLPLSYFRANVPVPAGWDARPCAYLAFGDTYERERQTAEDRGWAVSLVDGHHLEMTIHPAAVAAELVALLARAEAGPSRG